MRVQAREMAEASNRKPTLFRKIFLSILAAIVILVILGTCLFFFYVASAPKVTTSDLSSNNSTKIYDANGHIISRLGAQNRQYAKSNQIPTQLTGAITSIEDRHFYKDHGIDPVRTVKAAFADLTGSQLGLQGGSTLTQQLVKLSVFSTAASDRTLKRKAQEAWLALKVNHRYPKSKIMEYYINKVYMGNNAYGMKTAAKYYYNKSLNQLNFPETAMLAGMPQSPSLYNPYRYPKYAKQRRDQVLISMLNNNKINKSQYYQAKATPIKAGLAKVHPSTNLNDRREKVIDAYLKQTIQELQAHKYKLHSGLKVYTNLNFADQKKLYNLANKTGSEVGFPNNQFQIGAAMVDPKNGKIDAMLGGRKQTVPFGFNRAIRTDRSSGSTMKPLMDYGPAIQYDYFPTYQVVHDTPYTYPGTNVKLEDFDKKYEGNITMRRALVESRNIPAIRTLHHVGIGPATKFLKGLGMTFNQKLQLQNGIGAYISPLQEAAAYSAFSNGGIYHKPYTIKKVVEPDGQTHHFKSPGHRAMSPATAFMMTNMLKGVITDPKGSGTAAKIDGLHEAGKTGTTQYPSDFKGSLPGYAAMDSWFTGYTKNYALSIWTGYDHQMEPGHYVNGSEVNIAQKFYKYAMQYAQRNKPNEDWTQPSDVGSVQRDGRTEYYVVGHPGDVEAKTNDSLRRVM
ncbi:MAG: penicillin-binding protein [Acetilactobacillus jinshanensis]